MSARKKMRRLSERLRARPGNPPGNSRKRAGAVHPGPASDDKRSPPRVVVPRFPIVGIGASAGGLEALQQLFGLMPADSTMAFVLVVHLNPDHASMMVEL